MERGRFVSAVLRPVIDVPTGTNLELAADLHHRIHEFCFISRSVNFPGDVRTLVQRALTRWRRDEYRAFRAAIDTFIQEPGNDGRQGSASGRSRASRRKGYEPVFLRLLPLAVMIIPFGIAFGVTSVEVGVPERRRAVDERRDPSRERRNSQVLDLWGDPLSSSQHGRCRAYRERAPYRDGGPQSAPSCAELNTSRQLLAVSLLSDANFADAQISVAVGP